ncbi:MAG TPA: hypothetical protein VJ793_17510 [Anaerolineae bacterium]|nr:hypothetical protein [Anaerolineae bacterium]
MNGNHRKTLRQFPAEAKLLLTLPPDDFRKRWAEEKPYWKVYADA